MKARLFPGIACRPNGISAGGALCLIMVTMAAHANECVPLLLWTNTNKHNIYVLWYIESNSQTYL